MSRQQFTEGAAGPRDYIELPEIPAHWKVLEVGPGRYPLLRADMYVDHDQSMLDEMPLDTATLCASLESGLPQIPDKAFDFVWCSHVMEHVEDPEGCAKTLSRVAKSGIIVMPSVFKEMLFNFEESDHKWLVLPHPRDGSVIMVRHNQEYIRRLKDPGLQVIAVQMFRTGTEDHEVFWEHEYARDWFRIHEGDMDIVIRWSGDFKLTVIQ